MVFHPSVEYFMLFQNNLFWTFEVILGAAEWFFAKVWIISCFFKTIDFEHLKSHWEQLNGFSPVCIKLCFIKFDFCENFLSHWGQWKVLLSLIFSIFTSFLLESMSATEKIF